MSSEFLVCLSLITTKLLTVSAITFTFTLALFNKIDVSVYIEKHLLV